MVFTMKYEKVRVKDIKLKYTGLNFLICFGIITKVNVIIQGKMSPVLN